MSSTYVGYLVPIVIVAACVLVAWFVRRRTKRRRGAVWQTSRSIVEATAGATFQDPAAEEAWRRLHASELESWFHDHESLLERASADDFANAREHLQETDTRRIEQLAAAVAAHPDPHRRAELSALLGAAQSTLAALEQEDYPRARRHHLVYRDYRDRWRRRPLTDEA